MGFLVISRFTFLKRIEQLRMPRVILSEEFSALSSAYCITFGYFFKSGGLILEGMHVYSVKFVNKFVTMGKFLKEFFFSFQVRQLCEHFRIHAFSLSYLKLKKWTPRIPLCLNKKRQATSWKRNISIKQLYSRNLMLIQRICSLQYAYCWVFALASFSSDVDVAVCGGATSCCLWETCLWLKTLSLGRPIPLRFIVSMVNWCWHAQQTMNSNYLLLAIEVSFGRVNNRQICKYVVTINKIITPGKGVRLLSERICFGGFEFESVWVCPHRFMDIWTGTFN